MTPPDDIVRFAERLDEDFILLGPPGHATIYQCVVCGTTVTKTSVAALDETNSFADYDGRPAHLGWHDKIDRALKNHAYAIRALRP